MEPAGAIYGGGRWVPHPLPWQLRTMAETVKDAVLLTCGEDATFYVGPRLYDQHGQRLGGCVPTIGRIRGAPLVSLCCRDPEWVAFHESWHYVNGEGEAEADAYAERMTGRKWNPR